jgi:hypothetical protein
MPSLALAHKWPPWLRMIKRLIESPIPMPPDFVL